MKLSTKLEKKKIEKQKTKGRKRSPGWRALRNAYKKAHPACEGCGGKVKVEIHHIKDFSTYPEEELKWKNLMSLCESGVCHRHIGHHGNYRKINLTPKLDALICYYKLKKQYE